MDACSHQSDHSDVGGHRARRHCGSLPWLAALAMLMPVAPGCRSMRPDAVTTANAGEHAAPAPTAGQDGFMDHWRDEAVRTRARAPENIGHSIVLAAALDGGQDERPRIERPLPERPLPTQEVTLVMRDARIADVLQALGRAANQNLLLGRGIEGVISVELRGVAWDEAFTGLLSNLGLHFKWAGNIIRIMTVEEFRQTLEIERLEKERQVLSQERLRTEPLILQTVNIHYANAALLVPILQDMLTAHDDAPRGVQVNERLNRRGSVSVDTENNALVIHAIRSDVLKMLDLIESLDRPRQQVLIEARIILANRETARQLGVQWGGAYRLGKDWLYAGARSTGVLGGTADTPINPTVGMLGNFPAPFAGATPAAAAAAGGAGAAAGAAVAPLLGGTGLSAGWAYQSLGDFVLSAQISALESEGKAHVLASPSITTLDNQEAVLQSGFEIPYQSHSEDEGTSVQFKEALLELRVQPHVIDNRMVRLRIHASNDEPDYSRVDTGVTSEPAISKRLAQTNVLLYNGETTVIGGLSKTYGTNTRSGVPWLGRIPLLGALFRNRSMDSRQEDMLIFITPYILQESPRPAASGPAGGGRGTPPETAPTDTPGSAP